MEKDYNSGEVIVKRGEISPYLYIILSGKVKIEESEKTYYLSEDDFIGEEGVFLKKPAQYTAIAAAETGVKLLKEGELETLLESGPDKILRIIRKSIAKRFDASDEFSEKNPLYISLLEIVEASIPFNVNTTEMIKVDISLMSLTEKMQISIPSLKNLLSVAERIGDISISEDSSIFTKNSSELKSRISSLYQSLFFGEAESEKRGLGQNNLLYYMKQIKTG